MSMRLDSWCSEAFQHGPADGQGRCPWCRTKHIDARPRAYDHEPVSELTLAYEQFYDPDFSALTPDDIARRYAMGQEK